MVMEEKLPEDESGAEDPPGKRFVLFPFRGLVCLVLRYIAPGFAGRGG